MRLVSQNLTQPKTCWCTEWLWIVTGQGHEETPQMRHSMTLTEPEFLTRLFIYNNTNKLLVSFLASLKPDPVDGRQERCTGAGPEGRDQVLLWSCSPASQAVHLQHYTGQQSRLLG